MAMIHVSRSGATLGVFEEEKVREGLRTGEFIGTDLGWMEGMPTWRPLSELESFRVAAPPPPQAAAPQPGAAAQSVVPVETPTAPTRTGLPWENRTSGSLVNALVDTVTMVLTKPDQAFALMKREGGLVDPVLYILILGTICGVIAVGFQSLFHSFGLFTGSHNQWDRLMGIGVGWFSIILLPVLIIVTVFIGSALVHLCLMIVGGAKQSFETTLRVVCFAGGSAHVLQIVPICGGVLAGIASLVLNTIGLARAHETDTWRALVAILLPVFVCCGGWLFIIFAIIGGAAASGSWH